MREAWDRDHIYLGVPYRSPHKTHWPACPGLNCVPVSFIPVLPISLAFPLNTLKPFSFV